MYVKSPAGFHCDRASEIDRSVHVFGERRAERGAPAACPDITVVGHEIMSEFGGRTSRHLDTEHRHELIIHVLPERADRDRARRDVTFELDIQMRRVLGCEPASFDKGRESALRRQPDPAVGRGHEFLGSRRQRAARHEHVEANVLARH
jgi:hypothetical protein